MLARWLAALTCSPLAGCQAEPLLSFDAPFVGSSHTQHSACLSLLVASARMLSFVSAQFDAPFVSSPRCFPLLAAHLPLTLPRRRSPLRLPSRQPPPIGSPALPIGKFLCLHRWLAGWQDTGWLRTLAVLSVATPCLSAGYTPCRPVSPTALPVDSVRCSPPSLLAAHVPSAPPSTCPLCPARRTLFISCMECLLSAPLTEQVLSPILRLSILTHDSVLFFLSFLTCWRASLFSLTAAVLPLPPIWLAVNPPFHWVYCVRACVPISSLFLISTHCLPLS